MTDRDALLATIEANPDDDLPRLVFADWLEEHARTDADRARAAFIRAQVEEYRAAEPWEDGVRGSHLLEERFAGDWLAAVPAGARPAVRFERGFPDRFALGNPPRFDLATDGLPAGLETAGELVLPASAGADAAGYYGAVADWPGLARVRRLGFSYTGMFGPVTAGLWRSPHLAGLEELDLTAEPLDTAALSGLAAGAGFPGVRRLALDAGADWPGPLLALGSAGAFPRLDGLTIHPTRRLVVGVTEAAVGFARSPMLAPVRRLAWRHGTFPPAAEFYDLLAAGAAAPGLEHLELPFGGPGWLGGFLAAFARPRLRRLALVGPAAAREPDAVAGLLAASPALSRLDGLAVLGPKLTAAAVIGLLESPHLRDLRHLDVTARPGDQMLGKYLTTSERVRRLESLYLGPSWANSRGPRRVRTALGGRLRGYSVTSRTFARLHPEDVP